VASPHDERMGDHAQDDTPEGWYALIGLAVALVILGFAAYGVVRIIGG